jgi:hypothetical protein
LFPLFVLPPFLAKITPGRARTEHCLRDGTGRLFTLGILMIGAGAERGGLGGVFMRLGRLVLGDPLSSQNWPLCAAKMMIDEAVHCCFLLSHNRNLKRRMTG